VPYDPAEDTTATSPRAGVVYKMKPTLSVFAGYSQSFLPVSGVAQNGERFDPQHGEQIEGGIKAENADGGLVATASVYRLNRTNMLVRDPANPAFRLQVGEQGSRGFELDVAARPLEGLQISTAYAFTTADILEDTRIPVGTPLSNVPRHTFNIWAQYRLQSGPLRQLGLAAGLYASSSKRGELATTSFLVPSYQVFDLAASYPIGRLLLSFNLQNVTDERYFESAQGVSSLYYGQPRTALLRLSAGF
jgi:iron complex outermembrane receptor protein